MPFADMREFIALLEKRGELLRIKQEVHWDLEIGAWLHKAIRTKQQPALVFEKITGYPEGYTVAGMLVPNSARWALALDFPENISWTEMIAGIYERCRKPIDPVIVPTGPCKDQKHTGSHCNLLEFPVPRYIARDGGRYLGTWHCVITKDPDTGERNVGMYRLMVHDRNSLGIFICPGEHAHFHYEKWKARGEPMPVAITLGQDEVLPLHSLWSWPYGVDEFAMAGAMRTAPVELVKCETVDLEVPATAEIVVEGHMSLTERRPEGPFGEYTGHMGALIKDGPVINVSAIHPPQESDLSRSAQRPAALRVRGRRGNLTRRRDFRGLTHLWSSRHHCGLRAAQQPGGDDRHLDSQDLRRAGFGCGKFRLRARPRSDGQERDRVRC